MKKLSWDDGMSTGARGDPMANSNPNSSCPDPNSGNPPEESPSEQRGLSCPPPTPSGTSPPAPLTTDLLYKGAALAIRAYLCKQAEIGAVKHQPSCLNVSAVGEGDSSRLKVKPWSLQGEEAWGGIKPWHGKRK